MSELLALVTLDCEHKTRIHYFLPSAVPSNLEDSFPSDRIQIQAFSKRLPGALDHIQIDRDGHFSLSAAIGSQRIIVTYSKRSEDEERARIEELLLQLCPPGCVLRLRRRQETEGA